MKRRILSVVLALVMLAGVPGFLPAASADSGAEAEMSAATEMNAAFAARLLRASRSAAQLSGSDDAAKDVNGDGSFTEADSIAVLRLLLFPPVQEIVPTEPVAFLPSTEVPLPDGKIALGEDFNLHGTVYSASPLLSVTASITRDLGGSIYPIETTVTFNEADNITRCRLEDAAGTLEKKSISDRIDFADLRYGAHTLTISAKSLEYPEGVTLASSVFTMAEVKPLVLTQNKFRENYSTALRFFGCDTSKFLFTFKWSSGRNITASGTWRDEYTVRTREWGRIHVDSVPYYELATRYLDTTFLRVHGNGHDTGIIPLSRLHLTTSGPFVTRFVSGRAYISHHTFGTAVDINHELSANRNSKENWEVIRSEVQDHLIYNGIAADGNRRYYDFTYTGQWKEYEERTPTSLLNYLLYELAFFRAGFRWGYYYDHTCDGMHFTLTDSSWEAHSRLDTGLRKVFTYYN